MNINEESNKKIDEMLLAGKRPIEIRHQTGASPTRVGYRREKLGIPKFSPGLFPNIEPRKRAARILEMKSSGRTYSEIGLEFGLSKQRVHKIFHKWKNL